MSLDTYDNLKLEIIDWSHRSDLDQKIDTFIDLAETAMFQNPQKVLKLREGETLDTSAASTASRYLALPAGYREMRRIRLDLDEGFSNLSYREPDQLRSVDGPGKPRFYTITSQIEFDTVPDEAYTVEFQYLADFTPLSSSNQTNHVLTNSPNIYLFGALTALFAYAVDELEKAKYEALFLSAIVGANKKNRLGQYSPGPVMKTAKS